VSVSAPEAYSYRRNPAVPDFPDDRPVIVFDGHCAFCSCWARFVLRHDRKGAFRLLAAQSALGEALYRHYGLAVDDYETNILLDGGRPYYRSEASIRMAEGLGLPWSLAGVLRLLPLGVRDRLYGVVARNRLRIAGRTETCMVPEPGHAGRFLG
jgi:predicted DCC family thiol-disulfide oxidoreductase YuxK